MQKITAHTARLSAAFILASAAPAFAQWTSDTSQNVPVRVASGDQGVPLVAAGPGGSTWIAHTDNSFAPGYKYVIQRLDAAGFPQFAGPVVLSPNRTSTSTQTYDMQCNAAGNAFVAFDSSGLYLQLVLPGGGLPFGTAGLFMPGSTGAFGPQVGAFADGSSVVCWGSGVTLNFQRVNADGTLGAAWQLAETGRAQVPSDIIPTDTPGEFIMLWVRAEGTNVVTSRKGLKIQKWGADNSQLWNGGVPMDIYTSSATPSKGIQVSYFPRLVNDNAGGAIVAWYDSGATRNAWLQHVLDDGSTVFPAEGIAASTTSSATEFRLSASAVHHSLDDEYTIVYERSNTAQSQFSVGAQRISSEGDRLSGDAGLQLSPTSFHASFINTVLTENQDALITWLQYTGTNNPMAVHAARLDSTGSPVWPTSPLEISTPSGNKSRLMTVASNTVGSEQPWAVAVWASGDAGSQDIRAMRINADGTFVGTACNTDYNQDGGGDTSDVLDLANDIASGTNSFPPNSPDFNQDGGADTSDVIAIADSIASGECPE